MVSEASQSTDFEDEEARINREIVKRLRENLEVAHLKNTYSISISYTSENPSMAARVANTLADLYLTDQLEAKFEATKRANDWLAERLEGLREEVKFAEQDVKNVREQSGIIQAGSTTVQEQQISDVNSQLIQARVNRSRVEARLGRAREVMKQSGSADTLAEVLGSKMIQELRFEESALHRKRAELGQRYGHRHPEMIQLEAELKDLQQKLHEEVNRIMESLENDLQSARAEEWSLQQSLNELRVEAQQTMQAELELKELERQADSARTLYQSYLTRFQETRDQGALQRPDARIISKAEVPTYPSHPRKKMTLGLVWLPG
jgi:polysaccharide biosynthesis transport protein